MASYRKDSALREEEILLDLCADDLSDVPLEYNEESDESESDTDFVVNMARRKSTPLVMSDSDSDNSAYEDNASSSTWKKKDLLRDLEPFLGQPGVKRAPKNSNNVLDVVSLFVGEDFFEMMCVQSNLYHSQNKHKYKESSKTGKWSDINITEMKKFFAILILMGQVRKDSLKEYWSTDPFIATNIFRELLTRNRFEHIWKAWHFSDNEEVSGTTDRLYKIRPVLEYLVEKFQNVYKPKQELSLDEAMIPWRGRLRIKTYNPAKIVKYGLLVRMVCESDSGYISNLEIYSAEGKKLEQTIFSLLKPHLDVWHHVYQDNYYNSVKIAELLLDKKVRVCGTIRPNRGLPVALKSEAKTLKRGQCTFSRKGEVILVVWKDKREVRMITTIHSARMGNSKVRDRTTGHVVKKPICILKYNECMKGVDRADMYLSYYSIMRKTMKWSKKVVLWLINCALFNAFRVYKTLNESNNIRFKGFLLQIAKEWAASRKEPDASSTAEDSKDKTTERAPSRDHSHRLSRDLSKHHLVPIVGKGTKKYHTRRCRVCASKKLRKETRYVCSTCGVPLHKGKCFMEYHTKKHY
jgi:hypothetical protein